MMTAAPSAFAVQQEEQTLSFPTAAGRDPDTNAATLGTSFTVARAGTVVGVEFFRVDSQNRATTVQLCGSGRRPLATASGVPLTNGWVGARFTTPVAVSPGTTYIASYFAPSGRYSHRLQGFATARTVEDLTAPVGAGLYRYGASPAKPTSRYQNEDYHVTPIFVADTTTTTTVTTTPPTTAPPAPPAGGTFPNPSTAGVPAGWAPAQTRTTDLRIATAGAVVQDIRLVNADLIVDAPNVTVRRVEIQGGQIENGASGQRDQCRNGLVVEDSTFIKAPGQVTRDTDEWAIGTGGFTARRVKIDGLPEGFRVGGKSWGCGPVTIEDTFVRLTPPTVCNDWHGDGIQGYDGGALTVRNTTLEMVETGGCGGTAPFFYPAGQGNVSATVDRLLVRGGGFPFRLGMPGSITGLKIVDRSWGYSPIDVKCSVVSPWQADIVAIDANYQPTATVRVQPCSTETGT